MGIIAWIAGIGQTAKAAWQIISWIRREKKEMEANVDAYLTEKRAKRWRENMEKMFVALEKGNGNFKKLPKLVRWFFAATTADNRLGQFGQWFLKSQKIEDKNPVLDEPLYPCH